MKNYKIFILLFLSLVVSSEVLSQIGTPIIKVDKSHEQEIELTRLKTVVKIVGKLVETKMMMKFYNPNNRTLEGELYFPLAQGAKVTGYALDINGDLVDGVMVTKQKARQVFEAEVRKGVDPGIIEKVKGNNFKTRVYPLPAKGSRLIQITIVDSLIEANGKNVFRMPLSLSKTIQKFTIRFEIANLKNKPQLEVKGMGDLQFSTWESGFFAEKTIAGKDLETEIRLELPEKDLSNVFVQKGSDGNKYFLIQDKIKKPTLAKKDKQLNEIVIFYDASGSFKKSRKDKEINLLEKLFNQYPKISKVNLIEFRNRISNNTEFKISNGDISKVIKSINSIQYDGGTSLGCLTVTENLRPDLTLLFSDGIHTFGADKIKNLNFPVYSVVSSDGADFSFLNNLSAKTGGRLLNLNKISALDAVKIIEEETFLYIPNDRNDGVEDLFPAVSQQVEQVFFATGILEGDSAEVTLKFGNNGKVEIEKTYEITSNNMLSGDLIRKYWAGKKISTLAASADKNRSQIISVSKKHSVLSQFTSMIVLERPGQYIEHQIIPPKSKPDWRKEYFDVLEKRASTKEEFRNSKLEQVVTMWNQRIKWWEQDYNISYDFRVNSGKKMSSISRSRNNIPGNRIESLNESDSMDASSVDSFHAPVLAREARDSLGGAREQRRIRPMSVSKSMKEVKSKSKIGVTHPTRRNVEPGVAIKAWDPKTPYTKRLKTLNDEEMFSQYMKEKAEFGNSPAFYLDCADVFRKAGQNDIALQILSNIAELELENPSLIRVLAHRLSQLEELDLSAMLFEEVLKLRPEEPQSYRDLALIYGRLANYDRAIELLYEVILKKWDRRFLEVEVIALEEMNNLIAKAKRLGKDNFKVDERLIKLLDVDLRIVMTWDADMTDMDLWVIEPSEEKAYYSNPRTQIGGLVSKDFTRGYGPEEYMIKKAMTGMYKIQTNFFGSRQQKLAGAVTLQVDVFSNYGRENEKRKSTTMRLKSKKNTFTVADIEF